MLAEASTSWLLMCDGMEDILALVDPECGEG